MGSFQHLPNGDDLETGSMPCPERGGAITPYEEIWRELPISTGTQSAWIVQKTDPSGTTFLGRLAGYFLAFRQTEGGSFSARREDWDAREEKWKLRYSIRGDELVSIVQCRMPIVDSERQWKFGDSVRVLGEQYQVCAFEILKGDEQTQS